MNTTYKVNNGKIDPEHFEDDSCNTTDCLLDAIVTQTKENTLPDKSLFNSLYKEIKNYTNELETTFDNEISISMFTDINKTVIFKVSILMYNFRDILKTEDVTFSDILNDNTLFDIKAKLLKSVVELFIRRSEMYACVSKNKLTISFKIDNNEIVIYSDVVSPKDNFFTDKSLVEDFLNKIEMINSDEFIIKTYNVRSSTDSHSERIQSKNIVDKNTLLKTILD
jgi:hypothetical protein